MNATLASQLLEANEQLVLAMIRAHADTAAAELALLNRPAPREREVPAAGEGGGLFNHMAYAQAVARRTGSQLGLLLVSVENLQDIADTLGEALGRAATGIAAERLSSMVRTSDVVFRHSDSQFMVLLPAVASADDALAVADSIVSALGLPARISGRSLRLEAVVGLAIFPDDGTDSDALIDRAVAAMYSARRRGLGSFYYRDEPGIDSRSTELRLAEAMPKPVAGPGDACIGSEVQRDANEQLLLTSLRTHDLLSASEQAYRRQAEFMGVVAHELRAPLGPISHAAELLRFLKEPEPVVPVVRGVIERQVAHMHRLVSDLLDITRISTGKIQLEIRRLELAGVIDEAVRDVRPAITARGQVLRLDVSGERLAINGDPQRLAQVIGNLLGNASKYTQNGGEIGLSAAVSGDRVRIAVTDNGIGISAGALEHVFDPFVQEDHARSFDSSGLGIGLSLVRELVRGHDGMVTASSEGAGRGSHFVVELPLAPG